MKWHADTLIPGHINWEQHSTEQQTAVSLVRRMWHLTSNEFLYKANEKTINNTRQCTPSSTRFIRKFFLISASHKQPIYNRCESTSFRVRFNYIWSCLHLNSDKILEISKSAQLSSCVSVCFWVIFVHLCVPFFVPSPSLLFTHINIQRVLSGNAQTHPLELLQFTLIIVFIYFFYWDSRELVSHIFALVALSIYANLGRKNSAIR